MLLSAVFATPAYPQMREEDRLGLILIVLLGFALILVVIFIPTIVAFRRVHPNRWLIFVVNFAFGGTIIGWIAALIWALRAVHISESGSNGGESGINLFANDPVTMRIEPALNNSNVPIDPALQATAQAKTAKDDAVATLQRLKALADSGAISTEEYAALKAPVLRRLVNTQA
ncbi:superinfection immunity protein [Ochrobactrum quorumnocens]|uniref:superinfection immunity protein n=1 Tax=Ochrobactrum quorumnocens TaxID=271865 RepID=UPI003B9EE2E0